MIAISLREKLNEMSVKSVDLIKFADFLFAAYNSITVWK